MFERSWHVERRLLRAFRFSIVAIAAATALAACASRPNPGPSPVSSSATLSDADLDAIAALLEIADARRPDTVVIDGALASSTAAVRAYAARTVGQVRIRARTETVRRLVADPDSMVAADAVFALGAMLDSGAAPTLATALGGTPTVVAAAAWSLGELGEMGRPAIEMVLRRAEPRHAIADVLQATAKLRPVPSEAITPYLTDSDRSIVRNAVYALTRSPVPNADTALLSVADHLPSGATDAAGTGVEVDLRAYLARGLARTSVREAQRPAALVALRRLVEDAHPHVRVNAVRSLSTYGSDGQPDVVRHLRDDDANVRVAVAQSLGNIPLLPTLWQQAWESDTGFTFRRAVLAAATRSRVRLAAIDPASPGAWQRQRDWHFRAAAAQSAASLTDIDSIVVPLLRDPDARVRAAAYGAAASWADSSAALGKPYGRPALITALDDADLFVRATVLGAVRQRARAADARRALDAWRRAERDPENDARLAALSVIAAAWRADSASFGQLRDTLSMLRAPMDPLERDAGRRISPLRHWSRDVTPPSLHPRSWYRDRARTLVAASLAGHNPTASIVTARGTLRIALYAADAPLTVDNFERLARRGYYDGVAFHRIVPNFVAQDGDPRGDGSGGPGYAIRDELNRRWYDRGAVGMALSGPDTGGSQYFITHSPQPHLDGHYTVFGQVVAGFDALDSLVQGDRILRITIQ